MLDPTSCIWLNTRRWIVGRIVNKKSLAKSSCEIEEYFTLSSIPTSSIHMMHILFYHMQIRGCTLIIFSKEPNG